MGEGDNKQRSRFYSVEVPDLQLSKDSRESKLRRSEIISQSAKLDNVNIKKGKSTLFGLDVHYGPA